MLLKQAPLSIIKGSLEQFQLMKPGQYDVVTIERTLECRPHAAAAVAKYFNPDGRIDQNHPRNFRIAL